MMHNSNFAAVNYDVNVKRSKAQSVYGAYCESGKDRL